MASRCRIRPLSTRTTAPSDAVRLNIPLPGRLVVEEVDGIRVAGGGRGDRGRGGRGFADDEKHDGEGLEVDVHLGGPTLQAYDVIRLCSVLL